MNSIEDVMSNEHLNAGGFFELEQHPTEGPLRAPRTPTNWSDSQPGARRPAPRLGEHSVEVLRETGYSDAEIADLQRHGVTSKAP